MRAGPEVGAQASQQGLGGPDDRLRHRPVRTGTPQLAQPAVLSVGQSVVQQLQNGPVALLEPGAQQFVALGEEAVPGAEGLRLDEDAARDLVRVEPGPPGDTPEGFHEQRPERFGVPAGPGQRGRGGHHHREQVGALAVAVQVEVLDQRAVEEDGLQAGHGHELALGELQGVLRAVDVDKPVGSGLGEDVTGAVVAVRVEDRGGEVGAPVVAGDERVRLQQQFAARMRQVGRVVAQFGDVHQLVVGDRGRCTTVSSSTPPASVEP